MHPVNDEQCLQVVQQAGAVAAASGARLQGRLRAAAAAAAARLGQVPPAAPAVGALARIPWAHANIVRNAWAARLLLLSAI